MAESSYFVMESKELKIVIQALADTLVQYILPQPVKEASPLLSSHVKEFSTSPDDDIKIVQSLLDCLDEDESDNAELSLELRNVLCKLHQSDVIICKAGKKYDAKKVTSIIIQFIDGTFLKQLSKDEACQICKTLCERKFISEKSCRSAVSENSASAICLEMLEHLKPRKPDWPFEFMEILQSLRNAQTNSDQGLGERQKQRADLLVPSSSEKEEKPPDDLLTKAEEALEMASKLSSKFSNFESESENNAFSKLKQQQKDDIYDFSDDYSDSDSEDTAPAARSNIHLREYQKELAQNALAGRNTIICAPTGSGKTIVASHIILNHLKNQDESKKKRKVAFLARTVPLVMQQFKCLEKFLSPQYKMENVTGDSEYSMCLHKLVMHYDVFVMTPRILENHVKGDNPLIPGGLAAFSLLIFDECHHTRKGEAYNTLMLPYLYTKKKCPGDLPQVIGLTASIGVEKAKNVEDAEKNILKICGNLDAESISIVKNNEKELKELVPVPKEEIIKLNERGSSEITNKILEIIENLEKSAQQNINEIKNEELQSLMKNIPRSKKSQQYGQWIVMMEQKAKIVERQPELETNSSVRSILIIAEHLKAYNVALEMYDLVQRRDIRAYLEKRFQPFLERKNMLTRTEKTFFSWFEELKIILKERKDPSNPNLKLLRNVIKDNLLKEDEGMDTDSRRKDVSKGIIFVQTRFLAQALASWLEHSRDGLLQALNASVFTGTQASEDEGGMTTVQQDEIIEKFKSGDVRLIVATSVAEEGIDIQECNLVIKYNHVGNEVTTMQMRGRSRKKGGKSVLLGFDSLYKKELINQYNLDLMKDAVSNISARDVKYFQEKNEKNQKEILQEDEISKLVKSNLKDQREDKPFKMVCKLCRQVVINSTDIKVIYDSHHVVVDREFMTKVVRRQNKALHVTGEMTLYGRAICKGKPEKNARCGSVLGFLMIFSKIPFIVLSVESFGFETDETRELRFFTSWKKVPYLIDDIKFEDIQRCLPPVRQESLNESVGSSDSFSENISAGDDSQQSRSRAGGPKDTGAGESKSVTQAKQLITDGPSGSAIAARPDHTDDSVTEAKAVAADPGSHPGVTAVPRDSGFLSNSKNKKSFSSDQSLTWQKRPVQEPNTSPTKEENESSTARSANRAENNYESSEVNQSATNGKTDANPKEKLQEQSQLHLADNDLDSKISLLNLEAFSTISSFHPSALKVSTKTSAVTESLTSPEISSSSDDEQN